MKTLPPLLSGGLMLMVFLAQPGASLLAAAGEVPAPEISLSLRGVGDAIVEQGEPLRIAVRIRVPRGAKEAIKLAPASGSWSDAIMVELAPAVGGAAVARAEAIGKPVTPHATLNAKQIAGGLWLVSSTAMQRVAPGDYMVRARLAIQSGSGWNGEVASEGMPIRVAAVSDSDYRVAQRAINRAHEALLGGRMEEAASIIDAVLQRTPDDGRLLVVRADIADRAGNPLAALLCLNRAQRARPPGRVGPPPLEREELEARARASFLGNQKPSTNPPAWSWPPAAVLALPEDELLALAKTKAVPPAAIPLATNPPAAVAPPTPTKPVEVVASAPANVGGSSSSGLVPAGELSDAKIRADTAGQWAATATAGSQYGKTQYSPAQATGAPNVPIVGNSPDAWCPAVRNIGMDWLELTFANPTRATEVRVRQSDASGAIAKVEAIEPDGTAHVWWEGADPYKAPAIREIVWFAVRVPPTAYRVARVKLTLNLASGPGYKQIDAVQLVAAP